MQRLLSLTPATTPTITTQPVSQSVNAGSALNLHVVAVGTAPLSYQWLKNGASIPGAIASSFSISAVQASDAGSYTVRVSNSGGSTFSSPAVVTVIISPSISLQPVSQSVNIGSSLTLSVTATGTTPLSYQWLKNGGEIPRATASSFSIVSAQGSDGGSYTVRVSNAAGSVLSSAANVSVVVPPVIETQPLSQTVNAGSALTLSVAAGGSAPLSYEWSKNGTPISGANASTFSIPAVQAADAGSYTVRVSNSAGSVASSPATIVVVVPPAITTQPLSQTVSAGSTLVLSVAATGTAPLTYEWLKDSAPVPGASGSTFSRSGAQGADAGSYTVRVSNSAGSIVSAAATITVVDSPGIITQPVSQSVNLGSTLGLSVTATGTGPLSYQWFKDGVLIPGATASSYSISAAQTSDAAAYTVRVSNSAGSETSSAAIVSVINPPVITTQPLSRTLNAGASLSFSVAATGSAPLSFQWIKNGVNIAGATAPTFMIGAVQAQDAGSYSVRVSNPAGSVMSSIATVTVMSPPNITVQPISQTLDAGDDLLLIVEVTGGQPLNYQWRKNGTAVPGAITPDFHVPSVRASDEGSYTVTISNPDGTVTSSPAIISIISPPSIVNQPASAVVQLGSPAILQVVATGTAPLAYQWSKGGVAIPGATSPAFTITSASTTDSGTYLVTVANLAGSTLSQPAILTVSLPGAPTITTQPSDVQVTVGSSFTLSVTATGTGPINHQWFRNGEAIPGATGAFYSVATPAASDAGLYNVQVSNAGGSTLSQSVRVTVGTPPVILTQPVSQSMEAGSDATFMVQASGSDPLNYRWIRGGYYIPSAMNSSYTISSVQAADQGSYQVEISNFAGTVQSSPVTLTVTGRPVIVVNPQSQTIAYGSGFTVTVQATGAAPLSYRWIKDGSYLPSAINASYTIFAADPTHGGRYWVEISNGAGTVTSQPALITVLTPAAPVISLQPIGTHVELGFGFNLSVQATGSGSLTYQWLKNGALIPGATSPTFSVVLAQPEDAGSYRVQVNNVAGYVLSNPAEITVGTAPVITQQPVGQSALPGTQVTLSVLATGSAPMSHRWLKDGTYIPGATSSLYSIASLSQIHAGSYTAEISNSVGRVISQPAFIGILNSTNPGPGTVTAPVVTAQPESKSADAGSTVTLSVEASGTGPITYRWILNGSYIAGATNSNLTIPSLTPSNGGTYLVEVAGPGGTVLSRPATLVITGFPAILTPPQSQNILAGDPFLLTVQVSGVAPFTYRWIRSGSYLPGATDSTFWVSAAQPGDAGSYSVEVINAAGRVVSPPATVVVIASPGGGGPNPPVGSAPRITLQPNSLAIMAGSSATFGVEAAGAGPLTFRWIRNGSYIPGANSSTLTIPSVALWDAGSYSVEIQNAFGSVASLPAVLSVTGAPAILTQPQSQALTIGNTLFLDAGVTGAQPISYRWVKGSSYITGATNRQMIIPAVTLGDGGSYYVEISNGAGNTVSQPAVITVSARGSYIVRQPESLTVDAGQPAVLQVEAASVFNLSFRWLHNGSYVNGGTSRTLTIPSALPAHAGTYSVEVSSTGGTEISDSVTLSVTGAPRILSDPQNTTVPVHSTLRLSAVVTGASPMTLRWIKDGSYLAATNQVLTISNVSLNDAGNYTLEVSNAAGQVISRAARVTVNGAPAITRQPRTQIVPVGSPLILDLEVQGAAPLIYHWVKNGSYIPGATNSTYQLAAIAGQDAGTYYVEVSNGAGTVLSQTATVTVSGAPVIVRQPSNQTVPVGSPLSITLDLEGVPPFSYRWMKGGSYLSNATNGTYHLPSVRLEDQGSYSVEISNGAGAVFSLPAFITVIDQPADTTLSVSLNTAGARSIAVSISGAPGAYDIQRTTNLAVGPWQTVVRTNITATTAVSIPLDGSGAAFFKAVRVQN